MKQYLLGACLVFATGAYAQKTTAPVLKKGQELIITTVNKMNVDMMMPMINNSTTTYKVKVLDVDAKNYKVLSTVTKLVVDGSMMGQSIAFDSDKKEDVNSDLGKEFGSTVNKSDTFLIDIQTGAGKSLSPEKPADAGDGLQGMMTGAMETSGVATVSSIFFVIPGEVKAGSSWTDSSSVEGIRTVNNYKIEKINDNLVTISTTGNADGSSTMEAQGQSMEMKMKTVSSGTIVVDTKTNMVQKRTNIADIDGSMDLGGQSMPFSSKTTIETVYK